MSNLSPFQPRRVRVIPWLTLPLRLSRVAGDSDLVFMWRWTFKGTFLEPIFGARPPPPPPPRLTDEAQFRKKFGERTARLKALGVDMPDEAEQKQQWEEHMPLYIHADMIYEYYFAPLVRLAAAPIASEPHPHFGYGVDDNWVTTLCQVDHSFSSSRLRVAVTAALSDASGGAGSGMPVAALIEIVIQYANPFDASAFVRTIPDYISFWQLKAVSDAANAATAAAAAKAAAEAKSSPAPEPVPEPEAATTAPKSRLNLKPSRVRAVPKPVQPTPKVVKPVVKGGVSVNLLIIRSREKGTGPKDQHGRQLAPPVTAASIADGVAAGDAQPALTGSHWLRWIDSLTPFRAVVQIGPIYFEWTGEELVCTSVARVSPTDR